MASSRVSRPRHARNHVGVSAAEQDLLSDYTQRLIDHLWTNSDIALLRSLFGLPVYHALARRERTRDEAAYRRHHRDMVLAICNLGGDARVLAKDPPEVDRDRPWVSDLARRGYDALMTIVMQGAGWYDPAYPLQASIDRQIAAAHLLLWPEPITDANMMPAPLPWFFSLAQHEGQPLGVYRHTHIGEQEQRIASRFERVLHGRQLPRDSLAPRQSTAVRERKQREDEAAVRAFRMRRQRKPWSEIAHDTTIKKLLESQTDLTHDQVRRLITRGRHLSTRA